MFKQHRVNRAAAGVAALLTVLATVGNAQGPGSMGQRPGRGAFEIGVMWLDLNALNSSLVAAGYPRLDDQVLTLGGSGHGEHGRWIIGGEGHGLMGKTRSTASGAYDLKLGGGYGLFRVGYKVVSRPVLDVYPMLGIGGGGVQLDILGRSSPTFNDVLTNPARSSRLSSGGFMLDIGTALDAKIRIENPKDPNIEGGLMFGVRAGYLFMPASGHWKLDGENSVAGGPEAKIQGAYVRFAIGGWGRKR